MSAGRAYFRRQAIERRRDPSQDARNQEAAQTLHERVAEQLAQSALLRQLSERAAAPAGATAGTG